MVELSQLYESKLYFTLSAPTYPYAEASRLVGVSKERVRRWVKGYDYSYYVTGNEKKREGHQDAIVHRSIKEKTTYTSFLDLIDLLFVKEFLRRGFSLQFIRKALEEAKIYLKTPHFASSRFFTGGSKIVLELPKDSKNMLALLTGGQFAFPQIIEELGDKIDFENVTGFGLATRWYPLGKEGMIVIDPLISFGRPTIMGSGVTTANVFDMYLGEKERFDQVCRWFDLARNHVEAAVEFEHSLAA